MYCIYIMSEVIHEEFGRSLQKGPADYIIY